MYRNRAEDRRADVMSTANGVGIGFGGDKAYQSWLRANPQDESVQSPAALNQKAAIMRLQSLYGSQRSPALRGAVRRRVN